MTAQFAERLYYKGHEVSMRTEPLRDYFSHGIDRPHFTSPNTACWRGYIGTWEILLDRLYLVNLTGTLADGSAATVATFFPDYPNRVFAHWYSGIISIPRGKLLKYVHLGWASTFEMDELITVEEGIVIHTEVRHNSTSSPDDK